MSHDAREVGIQYGSWLAEYRSGLERAEAIVRSQVHQRIAEVEQLAVEKKRTLESERHVSNEDLDALRMKRRARLAIIADPTSASVVKGLVYLFAAIVLIVADFAIMGRAVAQFAGLPWVSQESRRSFDVEVFADPASAMSNFPSLILLTLGILILGMFLKVWRDCYVSWTTEAPGSKLKRFEFVAASVLLILSILCILSMAAVRLTLPPLKNPHTGGLLHVANYVSVFLGVAFPLLSAGFFVKGYDLLAAALENAWDTVWHQTIGNPVLGLSRKRLAEVEALQAELRILEERKRALSEKSHMEEQIAKARLEYDEGYTVGVSELLRTDGREGLVAKLRPLIARRLVLGR